MFESTTALDTADRALGADVHLLALLTLRLHLVCPASRRSDHLHSKGFLPSADLTQVGVPAPSPAAHFCSARRGITVFPSRHKKQMSSLENPPGDGRCSRSPWVPQLPTPGPGPSGRERQLLESTFPPGAAFWLLSGSSESRGSWPVTAMFPFQAAGFGS